MAKIYLEHLHKRYGRSLALEDLTAEIQDRELIVFLGPSGCGKTTTLNCIAGIEQPTSGSIYFDNEDVTDWPPHKRNIAMVFQSALLYPHLTARDNIKMSLRIARMSKEEMEKRVKEVAELLEIHELLDKLPFHMSGGQRQRVATAKAIVRNPSVFLMDEPLASLDAAMREALRAEIVVLQKKLGITMVFVTHDQIEAMTMGDRVAVMQAGRLEQVGTADAIYNSPVNTFVAGFVGSPPMNFFEGTIKQHDNGYIFEHPKFYIELPGTIIQHCQESMEAKNITLGVRPQHISLLETPRPGAIKGQVYAVERLGKETVIIIEYESETKFKAIVPPFSKQNGGETVYLLPQAENVYLFDSKTRKNLLSGKST
ncbi:ABC transporter ATP-binding protein [Candidatus Aerophobetes bacterium]|nr:ABC transporter ATP-binding protein [Candidatus Aerophobetes bacterium]